MNACQISTTRDTLLVLKMWSVGFIWFSFICCLIVCDDEHKVSGQPTTDRHSAGREPVGDSNSSPFNAINDVIRELRTLNCIHTNSRDSVDQDAVLETSQRDGKRSENSTVDHQFHETRRQHETMLRNKTSDVLTAVERLVEQLEEGIGSDLNRMQSFVRDDAEQRETVVRNLTSNIQRMFQQQETRTEILIADVDAKIQQWHEMISRNVTSHLLSAVARLAEQQEELLRRTNRQDLEVHNVRAELGANKVELKTAINSTTEEIRSLALKKCNVFRIRLKMALLNIVGTQ